MRRRDREVKDTGRVLEILRECDCCRVALNDGGWPYIVPLSYGFEFDGGALRLYFHCAKQGKKLELMARDGRAAFELDCGHALERGEAACDYSYFYSSVMGRGTLSAVSDPAEREAALRLIMEHYTGRADWDFGGRWFDAAQLLRLDVTEWSCKENQP